MNRDLRSFFSSSVKRSTNKSTTPNKESTPKKEGNYALLSSNKIPKDEKSTTKNKTLFSNEIVDLPNDKPSKKASKKTQKEANNDLEEEIPKPTKKGKKATKKEEEPIQEIEEEIPKEFQIPAKKTTKKASKKKQKESVNELEEEIPEETNKEKNKSKKKKYSDYEKDNQLQEDFPKEPPAIKEKQSKPLPVKKKKKNIIDDDDIIIDEPIKTEDVLEKVPPRKIVKKSNNAIENTAAMEQEHKNIEIPKSTKKEIVEEEIKEKPKSKPKAIQQRKIVEKKEQLKEISVNDFFSMSFAKKEVKEEKHQNEIEDIQIDNADFNNNKDEDVEPMEIEDENFNKNQITNQNIPEEDQKQEAIKSKPKRKKLESIPEEELIPSKSNDFESVPSKSIPSEFIPSKSIPSNFIPPDWPSKSIPTKSAPLSNISKFSEDLSVQKQIKEEDYTNSLWTEKYNPNAIFEIIGNKLQIRTILNWLNNWVKNQSNPPDTSSKESVNLSKKALIISGPPGIGKTSSIRTLAKVRKYKIFELNASDKRNKESIMNSVGFLMNNKTINSEGMTSKNLIIMDEVDGMAGNEDKGGIKALIDIVKKTKTPIVFICNDIYNQKLKSLLNHCLDVRFEKPSVNDVLDRMKMINEKENLMLGDDDLQFIVEKFDCDIRQILNYLQMYSIKLKNNLNKKYDKSGLESFMKDKSVSLSAFDTFKLLLNRDQLNKYYLPEKEIDSLLNLFFVDFDMIPSLIEENYLYSGTNNLKTIAEAADYISIGDTIDKEIHIKNEWSLLPDKGLYSTIAPSLLTSGFIKFPRFPEYFAKQSSQKKIKREIRDLKMRFSRFNNITVKEEIANILMGNVINILNEEGKNGIDSIIKMMKDIGLNAYLFKEVLQDLQNQKNKDTFSKINAGLKSALTKKINDAFKTTVKGKKTSKVKKIIYEKRDEEGNVIEEGIEEEEESSSSFFEPIAKIKKKGASKKN